MDQSIFHFINQQWTSPALDLLMAALSDSGIWEPLFIAIGASALLLGGFRARAFVICLVLSLLIATQVTGLLKSAVDRHRPKHVENVRMVQLQRTRPAFLTLFKKPMIRFSDSSDRNRRPAHTSRPQQRPRRRAEPARRGKLRQLLGVAALATAIGAPARPDAFLLAFDHDTPSQDRTTPGSSRGNRASSTSTASSSDRNGAARASAGSSTGSPSRRRERTAAASSPAR